MSMRAPCAIVRLCPPAPPVSPAPSQPSPTLAAPVQVGRLEGGSRTYCSRYCASGANRNQEAEVRLMADQRTDFFANLNWFRKEDIEQMVRGDALTWAREQCPIPHTNYGGGMHIVTRYEDLKTAARHPEIFSSTWPNIDPVL